MLTLQNLLDQMAHAIGGQPDARISLTQVANDALAFLFNSHPWSFRERPPVTITTTAAQQFIALPADVGELISVARPNRDVALTTLQDLVFRRSMTLIPPPIASVFAALSFPTQASQAVEAPNPQLELFPTPTTSTDTYTVGYRAGPIALVNTTDVPNIPPAYERLLSLICRAFVRDLEEQASTSEWARVTEEVEKLKSHDALTQANLGQTRGGAVSDPALRVNFYINSVVPR